MRVLITNSKKFQVKRLLKMMGFLLVLILINLSFLPTNYDNDNDFSDEIDKNLKLSEISDKIHIDNNWTNAKAAGICTGSGTYADPYVIEDLIIDAEESGSCILVENSNKYFKIENCTVQYSEFLNLENYSEIIFYAGIKLTNTTNGMLISNNCSFNRYCGIFLEESNNNTIKENLAHQEGSNMLIIHNSNNNKIFNNTLINNRLVLTGMNNNLSKNNFYDAGIFIDGNITESTSHTIDTSNKVNGKPIYYYTNEIGLYPINFTGAGQIILVNTSKSLISNMEVSDSSTGISLYYSHDNDIYKNNISFNRYGIYFENSYNNNITENILNNNYYGLVVELNSYNNTIAMNNITKNVNGINIFGSNNNSVMWNKISNNDQIGIDCFYSDFSNLSYNTLNSNAIKYINCHNGTLMNNTLNFKGIRISQSDSNLILQNNINNSEYAGLSLYYNSNNNLSGNLLFNCGYFISSEDSFIDTNNKINDKKLYYYKNEINLTPFNFSNAGQVILTNCNDSLISDIDVSYGGHGISLYRSNNNTVKNCNSSFNNQYGIFLDLYSDNNTIAENDISNNQDGIFLRSDNNTIKENDIISNNVYGILIDNSGNNNTFYFNKFIENGEHVEDRGYDNKWDNGVIGNYWDNYTGIDENNDGIGDTPHYFSGGTDFLPIVDDQVPTITIQSPIANAVFGINAPDFLVEIVELYLDAMWYTIDGGITNSTFTENGTISQSAWDALAEGNIIILFYVNDTFGRLGSQEVIVKKDVTAPTIIINNPQNNDVIGATAPSFDISINEPNLDTVWYSLNGGTNITFTGVTGTINQALWDALPEGNVFIKFYANDKLGRIGFQEIIVNKVIPQPIPPEIPGYDLLFFVGTISFMVAIIIKKRVNHLN